MAEGITIPVFLDIDDIEFTGTDFKKIENTVRARLGRIRQVIADMLKLDPSLMTKEVNRTTQALNQTTGQVESALKSYQSALLAAAKSSEGYADALKDAEKAEKDLHAAADMLDLAKESRNAAQIRQATESYNAAYENFIRAKEVADPTVWAAEGTPEMLQRLLGAYNKLATAILAVTNAEQRASTAVENTENRRQQEIEESIQLEKRREAAMRTATVIETYQAVARALRTVYSILRRVGSILKSILTRVKNIVSGLISAVKNLRIFHKEGDSTTFSLSDGFKKLKRNILMFGFGFRTAYFAIKRLRTIFFNAFKTMAAQIPEINDQLNMFTMSLNRLKGSLATAFQPIVSRLIPILITFMEYLSRALEAVGSFFAVLTGQRVIYRAISNQEDYAASLDKTSKAAKQAKKELAEYDKLLVIHKDNESDNGSDTNNLPLNVTYEPVDVDAAISDFAERVKRAWQNADFTEIGQIVTQKALEVLRYIRENIVPRISAFINRLADSVVTFVDGADFEAIGKAVAGIINDLLHQLNAKRIGEALASIYNMFADFIHGLVHDIEWDQAGRVLGEFITGLFEKLDLLTRFENIGLIINGIATAIINFIQSIDPSALGEQLADGLNRLLDTLDPETIGQSFAAVLNALLQFLNKLFQKLDWTQLGTTIGETLASFFSNLNWKDFEDAAINFVNGLLTALEALVNSDDFIPTLENFISSLLHIIEGIDWNKFQSVFQTMFERIAAVLYLAWEGPIKAFIGRVWNLIAVTLNKYWQNGQLLNEYWQSLFLDLYNWWKTNVIDPIAEALDKFFSDVWQSTSNFYSDIWNSLTDTWNNASTWFNENVIQPISEFFFQLWEDVSNWTSQAWEDIKNFFINAPSWFSENVLDPIGEFFSGLWEGISQVTSDVWESIKSVWDGVANWFNTKVIQPISGFFERLGESVQDVWEGIKNGIKTPINGVLNFFGSMINKIIDGLNKFIRKINTIGFDVPDWVPIIGGQRWGFNLAELSQIQIPQLAKGAVIPPNKEFLAILGDQSSGVNIEAPLDTIKRAFMEVLKESPETTKEPIILQVDGETLAQIIWDENKKKYKQTGKYASSYT